MVGPDDVTGIRIESLQHAMAFAALFTELQDGRDHFLTGNRHE
jgi:hypothetical protein